MARPQTENGFVMIALDLFVALLTSGVPDNDMVVLSWVLLQSYGPHKRRDVHLDFVDIETYTGLHRNNARASAKSLVAGGYLQRNDDGSYRFLKDWEAFTTKRGEFAKRLKLAQFAKATLTHEKFNKKPKNTPVQTDFPSTSIAIQPNCPDNSKGNSDELGSSEKGQFKWIGTSAYAKPEDDDATPSVALTSDSSLACERVHAQQEREERDRENNTPERIDYSLYGKPKVETCPDFPEGDGGMWTVFPGKFSMPEKRAKAVFRMLWKGFERSKLCYEFYQRQNFHTEEVWIAAIRQAKTQDIAVGSLSYIEKIAADYQANGIPEPKAAEAKPKDARREAKPTPVLPRLQSSADRYRRPRSSGSH